MLSGQTIGLLFMISFVLSEKKLNVSTMHNSEYIRSNFTEMARAFGRNVEEYDVITDDLYVLKLFHIPGDKSKPVFLMHGVVDSADTFIIRGNKSLTKFLSDHNYDVWVGTARGSRYARKHLTLNPDINNQFWDFSFHEIGLYDLPALIDFILFATGERGLSAIGHSQGNAVFYVMGALKPEYNAKVKVLIALAPIAFITNVKPPITTLAKFSPIFNIILSTLNKEELLSDASLPRQFLTAVCPRVSDICRDMFMTLAGSDPEEFEPDLIPKVVAHYPTTTSRKNGLHLMQIWRRQRFAEYDYGDRNIWYYKSFDPPDYELDKVTMNVALFCSGNDNLSALKDVEMLRRLLPNVVEYRIMKQSRFNHVDYVWGKNMDKYLFPYIIDTLKKYD